jgi:hypothetical protein
VPDLDLELALAGCGRELSFPPTPDLVATVGRRLDTVRRPQWTRRRTLVLAFAVVLATAGIAAAVTASLHGLGIVLVDKIPPVKPGTTLDLGLQVRPSEARRLAGFKIVMPGKPLGPPDAWFVDDIGSGASSERAVALVWGKRNDLPPVRHGVSVLVTQTPGSVDPRFAQKLIPPGTTPLTVTVNGAPGVWISGKVHVLAWNDGGAFQQQKLRLVGNVLVWNHAGLLLRIEGARTLEEAQQLAASFA